MGRVIAVSNLKGGIGKTTTVVNVGAGLALKGARVLLVDTDAQGNLAMALGVRPRRTIYEVLVDGAKAADCITPARPNLDLLAADHTLLSATAEITRRSDWARALERALRPVAAGYDFVLVDSGGSLTPMNVNALMCASDVVAPTTVEPFSIKGLELLFSQIAQVKGSASSIRMIIPTMFDPRVRQSGELLAELQGRYGALVAPPVRINVRLSEAPSTGRTIYEHDPRSRGAADYAQLVEHISAVFGFAPVPQPRAPAPQPAAIPPQPAAAPSSAPPAAASQPRACPHCGRPLQHANVAGYRVDYCDNCRYRTQTLAHGPRR